MRFSITNVPLLKNKKKKNILTTSYFPGESDETAKLFSNGILTVRLFGRQFGNFEKRHIP